MRKTLLANYSTILIYIIAILIATTSCSDDYKLKNNKHTITKNVWETSYYIDYSINREIEITPETYIFNIDGSFVKIKGNDTISGTWILEEYNYMNMNSQTFKIAELSNKIMVLRYGNADFIYKRRK